MMDIGEIEQWLATREREAPQVESLSRGTIIGEWRVEAFLGSGLSADVYRVVSVRLGNHAALKLLKRNDEGLKERFLSEAEILRTLKLEVLPRFLGSGIFGDKPYFVMEFLSSLPEPMPKSDIPGFMCKLAKAVHTLHQAGYIHRDLKPGNVHLRFDGTPVLIDLGLAKKRGASVVDPIVRHGKEISIIDGKPVGVGTLDYSAPEQLMKAEFSVQSDIFSLGKILRALYEGKLPRSLKSVVRKATRERPEERYESAADFARAIKLRHAKTMSFATLSAALLALMILWPSAEPTVSESVVKISPKEAIEERILFAENLFLGRGMAPDKPAAVKLYMELAEGGDPRAQATIGHCYFNGIVFEKNQRVAVEWFEKSAAGGDLNGITDLAYCLFTGFGVEKKDPERAFALAQQAADRGHARAQQLLAEYNYYYKRSSLEDEIRNKEEFRRAKRLGSKRADLFLED